MEVNELIGFQRGRKMSPIAYMISSPNTVSLEAGARPG